MKRKRLGYIVLNPKGNPLGRQLSTKKLDAWSKAVLREHEYISTMFNRQWRLLHRKGYRCVPVIVEPRKGKGK